VGRSIKDGLVEGSERGSRARDAASISGRERGWHPASEPGWACRPESSIDMYALEADS